MKVIPVVFFIFLFGFCNAQFSNRIWCFGDSAGIDFSNLQTPIVFNSVGDTRGSCCSIADSSHNLLFYATSDWNLWWYTAPCYCAQKIINRNHSLMQNGDSLIGEIWYDQMLIIPFPNVPNKFYLFHLATYILPGLYYSVIDLSMNNGNGAVVQKNVLVTNINELFISVKAVKHGNGRDWWILFRPSCFQSGCNPTNEYYTLLIDDHGIQPISTQNIGSINSTNSGAMAFSPNGDRVAFINYLGLLELYDFDRCTGLLSNPITIRTETPNQPYSSTRFAFGVEFSESGEVLYASTSGQQSSKIYQYDLTAPDIGMSEYEVANIPTPMYTGGEIRRAPNGKIFWSCGWYDGIHFNYPYPDSAYNNINMNLSFINSPNLLGSLCTFLPFSYNLGGKRTYHGLPNNPDYNMLAWGGSVCDTLGLPNILGEINTPVSSLNIFYHSEWQTAFINASGLTGKNYSLHILAINGSEIYKENGYLISEYYTKDFHSDNLSTGTYLVLLETEKEKLVKKFIVD